MDDETIKAFELIGEWFLNLTKTEFLVVICLFLLFLFLLGMIHAYGSSK